MKKYFILRADGSSIFEQGYPLDFISHCHYLLTERSEEAYQVIYFEETSELAAVQADRGTGDKSPVLAFGATGNILKYILT